MGDEQILERKETKEVDSDARMTPRFTPPAHSTAPSNVWGPKNALKCRQLVLMAI